MHPRYVNNKQIYSHVPFCKFVEEVVFETLIVGVRVHSSLGNLLYTGKTHVGSRYDNRLYTEKNAEVAPLTAAKVTGVHDSNSVCILLAYTHDG